MSQKCCSKEDFVTVFQNHTTFRISKKKIRKLFFVKLTKQEFKHAESTTRSRTCKKLVRFSILSRKIHIFLNKDFISKYFLDVFAFSVMSQLLDGTRLPGKTDTFAINSFLVHNLCLCIRVALGYALRNSYAPLVLSKLRTPSMNQFSNLNDRLSSCFSCH